MNQPTRVSVRAATPLTSVHRALTDPAQLRIWLAELAESSCPTGTSSGAATPRGRRATSATVACGRYVVDLGLAARRRGDHGRDRLAAESGSSTIVTLTQTTSTSPTRSPARENPDAATINEFDPPRRLSIDWGDPGVSTWELSGSPGHTPHHHGAERVRREPPAVRGLGGILGGVSQLRRMHELAGWRPIWVDPRLPA